MRFNQNKERFVALAFEVKQFTSKDITNHFHTIYPDEPVIDGRTTPKEILQNLMDVNLLKYDGFTYSVIPDNEKFDIRTLGFHVYDSSQTTDVLLPEKGLIVRDPWIDMILDGIKPWEIRGSRTTIRGTVALIKSGTGKIYGTVDVVGSRELTLEEYESSEMLHRVPKEVRDQFRYKRIWAWILENPVRYATPIPYTHPQGAVIWVNLR